MTPDTAKQMYDVLVNLFQNNPEQQKCELLTQFYNYKWTSKCASENISEIKNIAYKLKTLNEEISDTMVITKIISSLPDKLKHFQTAWESTPTSEKTITNLTSRLMLEENRNSESSSTTDAVAFKVEKFHRQNRSQNYRNSSKEYKPLPVCRICRKNNHLEKNCFYLDQPTSSGNQQQRRRDGAPAAGRRNKVAFLTAANRYDTNNYIVDSAATAHLTYNRNVLTNVRDHTDNFKTADGKAIESTLIGKIDGKNVSLNDVQYVPDIKCNLLSVPKITENDGKVIFTKDYVQIQKNDTVILQGNKTPSGLYVVDIKPTTVQTDDFSGSVLLTANDWHRRLGHLGLKNMKKLQNMVDGMKFENTDTLNCRICLEAKHARTPFKGPLPKARRVNEILHSDVCTIETETYDGKKYFITILDDYTHYCEVYLMAKRSEVPNILKSFITRSNNYHERKVVTIKCDNAKEYETLKPWCFDQGISMQFNAPYSSASNGKAERLNRTLCNYTRSLLFDADLEKHFWGEAVQVAAYLMNRSPTLDLEVTPIELWTGSRPDLSKLRYFGSEAYVKELPNNKKLNRRSVKHIFMGYAPLGYRLWNENKQKIIIARDVEFLSIPTKTVNNGPDNTIVSLDYSNYDDQTDTEEQKTDTEEPKTDAEEQKTGSEDQEGEEEEDSDQNSAPDPLSPWGRDARLRAAPRPTTRYEDYITDLSNLSIFDNSIMLTYSEAMSSKNKNKWQTAIDHEQNSLAKNKTWKYVKIEEARGHKILNTRWVFKIKENGVYRARLVIRGFQEGKKNFEDTYSPVVHVSALRSILAVAAAEDMEVLAFDVKSAFINADCEDDVFIHIPEGYPSKEGYVCKLEKNLYGLQEAPKKWNVKVTSVLKKLGFNPIKSDPCIFKNADGTICIALYVDDGFIIGKNSTQMKQILKKIQEHFEIKIDYKPKSFLGMEIKIDKEGISLTQEKYIEDVLGKYHMSDCKPTDTPLPYTEKSNDRNINQSKFPYREAIGSLLFLSTRTRPDISFAVGYASRYMENPSNHDINNVKRILRYLQGTKHLGIKYKRGADLKSLNIYTDSDFAGDTQTRRSTSGWICLLGGTPISWGSRRQDTVALSSTEAEYIAASEATKNLLYLKNLISELTQTSPITTLYIDNLNTIKLIQTGNFNGRTRHIETRFHFISEKYRDNIFQVKYCPTNLMIADALTKPLPGPKFRNCIDLMIEKIY